MKKLLVLTFVFFAAVALWAQNYNQTFDDDVRQALYGALDQAAAALKTAPFGQKNIAILPMKAGNSLLIGRLKNMLVASGFNCIEGKSDPMWDEILKEIEWDERKDDILDPRSVVKFGRLKAAQILMQCELRIIDKNSDRVYAELELRATDIATAKVIWGKTVAHRHYFGKDIRGIISLDNNLRMLLKKNFDVAKKSITSPEFAGKINHIKSATVVPLTGDIDSYMTGLAIEMLTHTSISPKNPFIPSLSQTRVAARDGQLGSDAVFYGSVRALYMTTPIEETQGKKMVSKYTVNADIQLFLEDAKTGSILWSKTITLAEVVATEREMTAAELKEFRDAKMQALPDDIKEDVADNWKSYLKIFGIGIGAVILLVLAAMAIKSIVSYNSVR